MQADIGQELEKDRKGERFSLIDPPQLPEKPSSPNRPAILLLGLVLSLGGGVGSAAVLESLDDSVRGSKALAGLLQVPVLAVIPYMENNAERQRKRRIVRSHSRRHRLQLWGWRCCSSTFSSYRWTSFGSGRCDGCKCYVPADCEHPGISA